MINPDFYEWLGFSVEYFESDAAKLKAALEATDKKWKSNPNQKIQARSSMFKASIEEAINNPAEWKACYEQYKKKVDAKLSTLIDDASDYGVVSAERIKIISEKNKVSESYIENLAKSLGHTVAASGAKATNAEEETITLDEYFSEKDLAKTYGQYDKKIEEFGYTDLYEYINRERNYIEDKKSGNSAAGSSRVYVSSKSSNDEIKKNVKEILDYWDQYEATGTDSNRKGNNSKICPSLIKLLDTAPDFSGKYGKYLKYKEIEEEVFKRLKKALTFFEDPTAKKPKKPQLTEEQFDKFSGLLYKIVRDEETAKKLIRGYCKANDIELPRQSPDKRICPFCSVVYIKKPNVSVNECPNCRESFLVKCPKCGKSKNIVDDGICDGIRLIDYPLLRSKLTEAEEFFGHLNFSLAMSTVDEVLRVWPGFPGAEEKKKKYSEAETSLGQKIKEIEKLTKEGKYNTAKKYSEQVKSAFPGSAGTFTYIDETISKSKEMLKRCRAEADPDQKLKLLLSLSEMITDDIEIKAELQNYPIYPVTDLEAKVDATSGRVTVSWKSANRPNSVKYVVVKKNGGLVSNKDDGKQVTETQSFSVSDQIDSGVAYFYGVYAVRGDMLSPVVSTTKPVVYLEKLPLNVTVKDSGFAIDWKTVSGPVHAFYSESMISNYGEGTAISTVTPSGCQVSGVSNGVKYYVAVYTSITVDGANYTSPISTATVTPMVKIDPPQVTAKLGKNPGEYDITYDNPVPGSVLEFYYTERPNASVIENNTTDINNVRSNLMKVAVSPTGANTFLLKVEPSKKQMYVYPVIVRDTSATVGSKFFARYVKPVHITDKVASGGSLMIYIEAWPEGSDIIYVCINKDTYAADYKDCDRRVAIPKADYDKKRFLEIPNYTEGVYYISLFAKKNGEPTPVPVGNVDVIDNSAKYTLEYYFALSGLFKKGLELHIQNMDADILPELYIAVDQGRMPVVLNPGNELYTIPANGDAPGEVVVKVPGYEVKVNDYFNIFTNDKKYEFSPQGKSRLK